MPQQSQPRVRVRKSGDYTLADPTAPGVFHTPAIDQYFDADHPLVKAHPWAFGTDAELAQEVEATRGRESVPIAEVEQATAAPGEKRATRRTR